MKNINYICDSICKVTGKQCSFKISNKIAKSKRWDCANLIKHNELLNNITVKCSIKTLDGKPCLFGQKLNQLSKNQREQICQGHKLEVKEFKQTNDNRLVFRRYKQLVDKLFKDKKENLEKLKQFKNSNRDYTEWEIRRKTLNGFLNSELLKTHYEADIINNLKKLKYYLNFRDPKNKNTYKWNSKGHPHRELMNELYKEFANNEYIVDTETNSNKKWIKYDDFGQEIDDSNIFMWAFAKSKIYNNNNHKVDIYNLNDYLSHINSIKLREDWWIVNLKFDWEYLINPLIFYLVNKNNYSVLDNTSSEYQEYLNYNKDKSGANKKQLWEFMPKNSIYASIVVDESKSNSYIKKIIYAYIKNSNNKAIKLRDMYLILPFSVKDMGKYLSETLEREGNDDPILKKYCQKMNPPKICQKHFLDKENCFICKKFFPFYNVLRTANHKFSKVEIDYITADCIVPKEVYRRSDEIIKKVFGSKVFFKTTLGSTGQAIIKNWINKNNKNQWDDYFVNKIDKIDYDKIKKGSYTGGITFATPWALLRKFKNIKHADIVSAYPFAMYNFELPYGEKVLCEYTGKFGKCLNKNHFTYYNFENGLKVKLKKDGINFIKIKTDEKGINIYAPPNPNNWFSKTFYNEIDLMLLYDNYQVDDKYKYKVDICFNKKVFPELRKWIDICLKWKSEGKITGDKIMEQLFKLFMNIFYGKRAEQPHFNAYSLKLDNETLTVSQVESDYWKYDHIGFADCVTAISRIVLLKVIKHIGIYRVLYCDTDSVFYKGIELPDNEIIDLGYGENLEKYRIFTTTKELGKWEKTKNIIISFMVIGAKKYIYTEKIKDCEFKKTVKCAGLKKELIDLISYNNFKPHMTFKNVNLKSERSQFRKYTIMENRDYTVDNVYRSYLIYLVENYNILDIEYKREVKRLLIGYFQIPETEILLNNLDLNFNKLAKLLHINKYKPTKKILNAKNIVVNDISYRYETGGNI